MKAEKIEEQQATGYYAKWDNASSSPDQGVLPKAYYNDYNLNTTCETNAKIYTVLLSIMLYPSSYTQQLGLFALLVDTILLTGRRGTF